MATGTFKWYGKALEHLAKGNINWTTDTIKVSLHTSAYTPNHDTHDFFNDATGEVTGTGYTAGGATLGTKSVTYDAATNKVRLIAADTVWSSSTITNAKVAVIYKSRGGAATADELIGYCVFNENVSSVNGAFTLDYDQTNGIFDLTAVE